MGKFKKYGGWAVDGVEYSSARKASVAVGIPRSSFTRRCKSIGRRQVTSAELDRNWAVDGVEYPNARVAADAIGMPKTSFIWRCRCIGRRRVTSAELDQFRYAYPTRLGNDEWRALSDIGNTGLSRGMKR